MVDDQPIVLPEQGQEMRVHTPWPQPPAPATQPQTPEPHPRPWAPETHPRSGLQHLGLLTAQKPHLAAPNLREAGPAGNTSDVDVDQQLLSESAGCNSLPDVPLPDAPRHNASPEGLVGNEWTSLPFAAEVMVVVFSLGSDSCLVLFLCPNRLVSGIEYYMRREVFGLLRVYYIYGVCIGFI